MTAVHHRSRFLTNDLENFVFKAIAHGQRLFQATQPQDRVKVALGGLSFECAESDEFLKPSLQHCLFAAPNNVGQASDASVFIDYSGWHLGHQGDLLFLRDENPLQFDTRLAKIGMRASYSQDRDAWDIFDPASRFGVRLQPGTTATAIWESTAPLAYFCKWIAELDQKTMVHAGSVAIGGVGALLVGPGGAGKSGTVLGAMLCGFQSAGDDYTLISAQNGYRAHAVYRSVKQDPKGLARLGLVLENALNWQGKAVFRPETVGANRIVESTPISVLLVPATGATKTRFYPIDPANAFKTLAFPTIAQLNGSNAAVFRACAALVRDVPCFGIDLSPDKDEIALELANFLGKLPC